MNCLQKLLGQQLPWSLPRRQLRQYQPAQAGSGSGAHRSLLLTSEGGGYRRGAHCRRHAIPAAVPLGADAKACVWAGAARRSDAIASNSKGSCTIRSWSRSPITLVPSHASCQDPKQARNRLGRWGAGCGTQSRLNPPFACPCFSRRLRLLRLLLPSSLPPLLLVPPAQHIRRKSLPIGQPTTPSVRRTKRLLPNVGGLSERSSSSAEPFRAAG